jgi:hypothetical protein
MPAPELLRCPETDELFDVGRRPFPYKFLLKHYPLRRYYAHDRRSEVA